MKDKKFWIAVGVLIILMIFLIVKVKSKGKDKNQDIIQENQTKVEEFVNTLSDGTKVNTSNKLAETKIIDGLEVSNIRLTEKNNLSKILATVKNPTTQDKGGYAVTIKLLDKNGDVLKEIEAYIDKVKAGDTVTLNTAATVDFANAYDFTITKK